MDEKKVREAIEELKDDINFYESMIRDNKSVTSLCARLKAKIENLTIAIEALEKQLPMKVNVWANGTEHCPVCDKDLTYTGLHICPECCQRIDWSE